MEYLIVAILALIVGVAAGFFGRKIFAEGQITSAKKYAAQIIEGAQKEAGSIKKEAELESKDTILKAHADFDAKTRETKAEIANVEKKVRQREENLDKKMEIIDKKEKDLSTKEKSLNDLEKKLSTRDQELDTVIADQRKKLENISGLSAESAKQELIRSMMDAAKQESLLMLKRLEEETKETAERKPATLFQ